MPPGMGPGPQYGLWNIWSQIDILEMALNDPGILSQLAKFGYFMLAYLQATSLSLLLNT